MDCFSKKPNVKIKEPIVPKQVKIAFVGASGVGKSSLANYSLEDQKVISTEKTSLVDMVFKKIKLRDTAIINYSIWDFSGNSDSFKIRTELYPELHAVAYCFDLSNRSSFENVQTWVDEIKKAGGSKLVPILIGLKADLSKAVDFGEIQNFTSKTKMNYFEISTKDLASVKKFYVEFGNVLYDYIKPGKK